MSYFSDNFITLVSNYIAGNEYKQKDIVKFNGYVYIAKKDTTNMPTEKTTTDDWEYVCEEECIKIIANIGSLTKDTNIGTKDNPFLEANLVNKINLQLKNKVNRPGYFSCLKFGKDVVDENNAVSLGVLYDADIKNPSLTAVTNCLDEINLGSGYFRFKDIYSNSSPIVMSDENHISSLEDISDKYLELFSKLHPVAYVLSKENSTSGRMHIGFLASEVESALEELGMTSDEFAGLIKIPVIKRDLYVDHSINDPIMKRYHYELDEEVPDTSDTQYVTGENLIRYSKLPICRKHIESIVFKNYPLQNGETADDAKIIVKSMEFVPFDKSKDNLRIDFSKVIFRESYNYEINCGAHANVLEDGSLEITFDENNLNDYLRGYQNVGVRLTDDINTTIDLTEYEYVKVVSTFKRPYLLGYDEFNSIEHQTEYHPYQVAEEYDFYCYSQDDQFSIDDYIYALRYEEFIALNTKKIQEQDKEIKGLKNRISALEELIKNK